MALFNVNAIALDLDVRGINNVDSKYKELCKSEKLPICTEFDAESVALDFVEPSVAGDKVGRMTFCDDNGIPRWNVLRIGDTAFKQGKLFTGIKFLTVTSSKTNDKRSKCVRDTNGTRTPKHAMFFRDANTPTPE